MARLAPLLRDRQWWVKIHRWAGLYMATFLVVAGLTGSVLAFYNELDAWLNPASSHVPVSGPALDPVDLLERAKRLAPPTVQVSEALSLGTAPGVPVGFIADPVTDPRTGAPFENVPRELRLNPYTGALVHTRFGEPALWPVTRENLLDIVFRLHYSLALPGGWGTWLFGIAALVWTIDCFVGVYLTFPLRIRRSAGAAAPAKAPRTWWRRWTPAWLVRWRGGGVKVNFDLHRAGGLWLWLAFFVFAWSSVRLNLDSEVYEPVMRTFFDMSVAAPPVVSRPHPADPVRLGWHQALARARQLAAERGVLDHYTVRSETELALDRASGQYTYRFQSSADINDGTYLTFDADTGAFQSILLSDRKKFGPWISEWITGIHMAQVGGRPMQWFVMLVGIATAGLSLTGVIIWWRKFRARRIGARRRAGNQRTPSAGTTAPARMADD